MDAVDWTGLSVLAALLVGCIGYLSRQMHRLDDRLTGEMRALRGDMRADFDRLRADVVPRLDRLEERYVRHLEAHVTH